APAGFSPKPYPARYQIPTMSSGLPIAKKEARSERSSRLPRRPGACSWTCAAFAGDAGRAVRAGMSPVYSDARSDRMAFIGLYNGCVAMKARSDSKAPPVVEQASAQDHERMRSLGRWKHESHAEVLAEHLRLGGRARLEAAV